MPTRLLDAFSCRVKARHSGPLSIICSRRTRPQSPQTISPVSWLRTRFKLPHSGHFSTVRNRISFFCMIFHPVILTRKIHHYRGSSSRSESKTVHLARAFLIFSACFIKIFSRHKTSFNAHAFVVLSKICTCLSPARALHRCRDRQKIQR